MGFFSWKTADTGVSIYNAHSRNFVPKQVYLLQPNGEQPIMENCYNGYGIFGGIDAYSWLAQRNTGINCRHLGIFLSSDSVVKVENNGEISYYGTFKPDNDVLSFIEQYIPNYNSVDDYATPINESGDTLNSLLLNDAEIDVRELIPITHPLKFSFDPNAVYESLPESKRCPHWGI